MKRYNDYMDGVEVSDTLHEKLKNLEPPQKRPAAWKKYGGLAAALILAAGLGGWGLSRGGWSALMDNFHPTGSWDDLTDHFDPAVGAIEADRDELPKPDIAEDYFFEDYEPHTGGGYEVVHGEGPDAMVSYYLLPYLNWVDASQGEAMDYSLAPPSAIRRDAVLDDVLAFAGGQRAMADHLLWDGLDWDGLFWFLEDGTPCAAALYADGNGVSFSLEVMKGGKVPSCIVLPDEYYETSQWQGVEITAVKNGGYMVTDNGAELREKREVSFFCDGVGYKLTLYAADAVRADELCARFVRYAVDGGFDLNALTANGTAPARYAAPTNYSVGEPNWEDAVPDFVPDYDPAYEDGVPEKDDGLDEFYFCDCPDCIADIDHTHPYAPNVTDPNVTSDAETHPFD